MIALDLLFRVVDDSEVAQAEKIAIGNEHRQHYLFRVVFPCFTPCMRLSPHTAFHREQVAFVGLLSNSVRIVSSRFGQSTFILIDFFYFQASCDISQVSLTFLLTNPLAIFRYELVDDNRDVSLQGLTPC